MVLRVRKQRQRQTYSHGCSDPVACASGHHKVKPCPQPCRTHKRQCPPPCSLDCAKHAKYFPQRTGGVVDVDVKSRAGRRGIRLPDQLFVLLMKHEAAQARERELAGDLWSESDFMFTQPNGKPIDPRSDHNEGRLSWRRPMSETRSCMMPGTPPRRYCSCSVCRCQPSWKLWAGPTRRSSSVTPTSQLRSRTASRRRSTRCCGGQHRSEDVVPNWRLDSKVQANRLRLEHTRRALSRPRWSRPTSLPHRLRIVVMADGPGPVLS